MVQVHYEKIHFITERTLHSEHARQNRYYAEIAIIVLSDGSSIRRRQLPDGSSIRARLKVPDRYHYFLPAADTNEPYYRAKWDVLAQLGRVDIRKLREYMPAIRFLQMRSAS